VATILTEESETVSMAIAKLIPIEAFAFLSLTNIFFASLQQLEQLI